MRRLFACLGDSSRFRLVRVLARGPHCVSDLATAVGLSQSCTTRHLQALARDGVVVRRREGKRVMFRLEEDDLALARVIGLMTSDIAGKAAAGPGRAEKTPARGHRSPADSAAVPPARTPAEEATREGPSPDVPAPDGRSGEGATQQPPMRPGDLEDYLL